MSNINFKRMQVRMYGIYKIFMQIAYKYNNVHIFVWMYVYIRAMSGHKTQTEGYPIKGSQRITVSSVVRERMRGAVHMGFIKSSKLVTINLWCYKCWNICMFVCLPMSVSDSSDAHCKCRKLKAKMLKFYSSAELLETHPYLHKQREFFPRWQRILLSCSRHEVLKCIYIDVSRYGLSPKQTFFNLKK